MDDPLLWLPVDTLALLEQGGPVLWLILSLSCLMWGLITYLYLQLWTGDRAGSGGRLWLPLIGALVQVLPLLGLLGTVEGMIQVFTVLASHGSGNIRGMAGGISTALVTTMAGLMTSISGFYFVNDLRFRFPGALDPAEEA